MFFVLFALTLPLNAEITEDLKQFQVQTCEKMKQLHAYTIKTMHDGKASKEAFRKHKNFVKSLRIRIKKFITKEKRKNNGKGRKDNLLVAEFIQARINRCTFLGNQAIRLHNKQKWLIEGPEDIKAWIEFTGK